MGMILPAAGHFQEGCHRLRVEVLPDRPVRDEYAWIVPGVSREFWRLRRCRRGDWKQLVEM